MTKKRAKILRKLNNLNEENMSKESDKIYTDMVLYLRFSDLTLLQQEIVRSDLIQMIIDGEERGESIQEILGGNYKAVCDEIIATFPPMSKKDKVINFLSIGSLSSSVILLVFVLTQVITNILSKKNILTFDFIDSYLVFLPLSLFIAWIVARKVSKTAVKETSNSKIKRRELFKTWFLFMIFVSITVIVQDQLNGILFQTPLIIIGAVIFLLFITHFLLESKTDY